MLSRGTRHAPVFAAAVALASSIACTGQVVPLDWTGTGDVYRPGGDGDHAGDAPGSYPCQSYDPGTIQHRCGLCQRTGGTWDTTSCGDFTCGGVPMCEGLTAACNCGIGFSFDPVVGCFHDTSCDGCDGDNPLCCTSWTAEPFSAAHCRDGEWVCDQAGEPCE